MAPSCVMVMTTVHDSPILDGYRRNFERFGHLDSVRVIVIPDRKTPAATSRRCAALAAEGLNVICPSLDEQAQFLHRLGTFGDRVPLDSDNRRNVGYLMALQSDCDFLISIYESNTGYQKPAEGCNVATSNRATNSQIGMTIVSSTNPSESVCVEQRDYRVLAANGISLCLPDIELCADGAQS